MLRSSRPCERRNGRKGRCSREQTTAPRESVKLRAMRCVKREEAGSEPALASLKKRANHIGFALRSASVFRHGASNA